MPKATQQVSHRIRIQTQAVGPIPPVHKLAEPRLVQGRGDQMGRAGVRPPEVKKSGPSRPRAWALSFQTTSLGLDCVQPRLFLEITPPWPPPGEVTPLLRARVLSAPSGTAAPRAARPTQPADGTAGGLRGAAPPCPSGPGPSPAS